MSSNIYLKKVCQHCDKVFTARTTVTKFCSDDCAKKNYKLRQKEANITKSNQATKEQLSSPKIKGPDSKVGIEQIEIIDIKMLSAMVTLSERTIKRLLKDRHFPRLYIGSNLRFHKQTVIEYIIKKFGN